MHRRDFQRIIEAIMRDDKRYAAGAYVFVRMALDYTVKNSSVANPGKKASHVSAAQLLEGVREFALETFGPMSAVLFEEWGVKSTADIGEIVFNMIKVGEMSKTDEDRLEDFSGGYDFHDAFVRPYMPIAKGGV